MGNGMRRLAKKKASKVTIKHHHKHKEFTDNESSKEQKRFSSIEEDRSLSKK